jgi:calcineurin-like phosphoesterase family protein
VQTAGTWHANTIYQQGMKMMMKTFLVADTHFGCDRLIETTRADWVSVANHDSYLIRLINETVGKADRLVLLGDVARDYKTMFNRRTQIECRNIDIVLGNHDKQSHASSVFGQGKVHASLMLKVGPPEDRKLIYCAHFPHAYWDKSHYGSYHAYGHCHSQREAAMDAMMPARRSMDVGVDNLVKLFSEPRPIEVHDFLKRLSDRAGHEHIDPADRWKKREYSENEV